MRDDPCVCFLQDCLPRMGLQWRGYRKVRGMVCKRVRRRLCELSLADYGAYRTHLDASPSEWDTFAEMCRIPISRFYRDKGVFAALEGRLLPLLAEDARRAGRTHVSLWSAGCASGEEPYSVSILWALEVAPNFPDLSLRVLATDAEPHMVARAKRGCYKQGSLKDVPSCWTSRAFLPGNAEHCVRERFRHAVTFETADFMRDAPDELFDLILCRNVAFTYFALEEQQKALQILARRLRQNGFLVLGAHEELPPPADEFSSLASVPIYRKLTRPGVGASDKRDT